MTLHDPALAETIDRIYDAAALPEAWPGLLDMISRLADGRGGVLLSVGAQVGPWVASDCLRDMVESYFLRGFHEDRSVADRLLALPGDEFYSDLEHLPEELMADHPLYAKLVRPSGTGHTAATHLRLPDRDPLVLIVAKDAGAPPVDRDQLERLTALRPHLGRSAMLASRLDAEQVRGAISGFCHAGMAACAIDLDGMVLESNSRMADMSAYAINDAARMLRLRSPVAQASLMAFLAEIRAAGQLHDLPGQSIAMPAGHNGIPAVVHLVPVRHRAANVFSRAAAYVVFAPLLDPPPPQSELLQGLFDLSSSEAKVLHLIATCLEVNQIADRLAISRDTVRFHLKNIFTKTGVSRQSDLTCVIGSISRFPHEKS